MNKSRLSGAVCACLFWSYTSLAQSATLTITTDSESMLSGSFLATGDDLLVEPTFGLNFQSLPGSSSNSSIAVERDDIPPVTPDYIELYFGTQLSGTPDWPKFTTNIATDGDPLSFGDVSGSYQSRGGETVNFLFTSLHDSGGLNGTFSGNFVFTTAVPLPPTILLFMSGLIGLIGLIGMARRRKDA